MALRAILFISIILLFIEGGATGNNDDFDLPKTSSYEAHRFGLDSTNLTQLEEFFHPKFPREYKEPDKSASSVKALADYPIKPTYVNGALWHGTYDINVINNIAYVSMAEGMGIFDVSDPANPEVMTLYYNGRGGVYKVEAKDNIFATTNGGMGGYTIEILDMGDPYHPQFLGGYSGGWGGGVSFNGRYAFLCTAGSPVAVDFLYYDNPVVIATASRPGDSYTITRRGSIGYITTVGGGLALNRLSSPPLTFLGATGIQGQATSVDLRDNYAYVTECGYSNKNCLLIVDISDTLNPAISNSWTGWSYGDGPYAVKIVDSIMYMTTYSGYDGPIVIASLSDPVNPQILSYYHTFPYDHPTATMGLDVEGNYCYVAHEHAGFSIGDVSNPTAPQQVGFFNPLGLNKGGQLWGLLELQIIDNYAYALDQSAGLIILDISDPANPIVLGYDDFGEIRNFAVAGNYAYIAQNYFGVRITDITDKSNPRIVSNYYTPGYGRDVVINGNYCYVAADTSGLQILDITDPLNITRVGYYNADYYGGHEAYSIALKDSLVLLGGYFGLQIINVKDPAHPTAISRAEFGQYCWDIKVRDNMVYLALDNAVASVDISNPEYPYVMKTISDYGDDPFNLCLYDNYLLMANLGGGGNQVEIFDISTPGDMIPAGVIQTAGHYATDVAAVGKYIYVADYYGILVMDGDFPVTCGDADGSRKIDLLDVSATINYLYRGGSVPDVSALDVDGSGKANLLDVSYLIKYMYLGGPTPHCGG